MDKTKEEFDNIYKSIKSPSKYSSEARIASLVSDYLQRLISKKLKNLLDNK